MIVKSRESAKSPYSCFHEFLLFVNLENKIYRNQEFLTAIWNTQQLAVFVRNSMVCISDMSVKRLIDNVAYIEPFAPLPTACRQNRRRGSIFAVDNLDEKLYNF